MTTSTRSIVQTKAALSSTPGGEFTLEAVDLEAPRAGEVLVRMVASGVCHTDVTFNKNWNADAMPMVFGHEGAGVVEEVGPDVTGVKAGDHVITSFRGCGTCAMCKAHLPGYCPDFYTLNGTGTRPDGSTSMTRDGSPVFGHFMGQSTFADHAVLPVGNVLVVPESLDLHVAAAFGCSVLTGAGAVMNVLGVGKGASFVLFGAGGVGFAGLLAAKAAGAKDLVVVDPVAERRELGLSLGATAAIDPMGGDVVEQVQTAVSGGATHVLETTALPAVFSQAVACLGPLGRLVPVGIGAPEVTLDAVGLQFKGISVSGCLMGNAEPSSFIPKLLALHEAGNLPVDRLMRDYAFVDINRAVEDHVKGLTVKPVLTF
jgi:aryl-alcohol dehydrogenase